MKSITKKRLGLTAGLTGVLFAAGALQAEPFEPGIDFTADVVSGYIFRGADLHQAKFEQDKKSISSFNAAPAFQPSLTFKFAEGWSLNVWGSFALVGRNDVDSDEVFQTAPGAGDDLGYLQAISDNITTGTPIDLAGLVTAASPGYTVPSNSALAGQTDVPPGWHKEANGLKRFDEVDITLSYSTSSKLGTMSGGIITYNYVNSVQQTASDIEMFAGFAPAVLPNMTFTSYVNVATPGRSGSTYNQVAYALSYELSKSLSVSLTPTVAYATDTARKIAGWQNASLPLSFTMGGLHFGVTGVYRTDIRFYDTDTAKGDGIAYFGGSSINDGMVADPGKTYGLTNGLLNLMTSNAIATSIAGYSYAPRQHLPKLVYYYTVGYSTSF